MTNSDVFDKINIKLEFAHASLIVLSDQMENGSGLNPNIIVSAIYSAVDHLESIKKIMSETLKEQQGGKNE